MKHEMSFKIRSYGRMELASLYSPDLTGMLRQQLDALGYRPDRRTFTPLEVKAIVEALGEP